MKMCNGRARQVSSEAFEARAVPALQQKKGGWGYIRRCVGSAYLTATFSLLCRKVRAHVAQRRKEAIQMSALHGGVSNISCVQGKSFYEMTRREPYNFIPAVLHGFRVGGGGREREKERDKEEERKREEASFAGITGRKPMCSLFLSKYNQRRVEHLPISPTYRA